jgi:hypothetical protein
MTKRALEISLADLDLLPGVPLIFACARRDMLVELARRGDKDALETLLKYVPEHLDPSDRRGWRDGHLRSIAAWLSSIRPNFSQTRIARLMVMAGRCLEMQGHSLDQEPFKPALDASDRAEFAVRVKQVLEGMDGTDGTHWPSTTQMKQIIGRK